MPLVVAAFYLVGFSTGIEAITGLPARWVEILSKAALAVWIIINLPVLYKVFDVKMMVILFAAAIMAVSNIMFFPDNQQFFWNTLFNFVTVSLPVMLFAYAAVDADWIAQRLLRMSRWICVVTLAIFGLMIVRGSLWRFNYGKYSMGYGYTCALPTLVMLMSFIQRPNLKDLLGTVSLVLIIITFGSRGPLLGIALFGMLFGVRRMLAKRRYLLLVGCAVLLIVAWFSYRYLLLELVSLLDKIGIESRTLRLFLQEGIYTSGRDRLYNILMAEIIDNPLRIRGINAEWQLLGVYAHNIALELVYQGGVLLGGGAVVLILCCGLDTMLFAPEDSAGILEIIFGCLSLTQLMYSSSLWNTYTFWVWVALLLRRRSRAARLQSELRIGFDG